MTPQTPPTDRPLTAGDVDRVMAVLDHWFDSKLKIDRNSEMVAQLAALASPPVSERERELEGLFATIRDNSWDLRCFNMPTGGDDHEIGWRVIGHWQAAPCERTIAEVYRDDPIAAVRAALTAQPAGEGK